MERYQSVFIVEQYFKNKLWQWKISTKEYVCTKKVRRPFIWYAILYIILLLYTLWIIINKKFIIFNYKPLFSIKIIFSKISSIKILDNIYNKYIIA